MPPPTAVQPDPVQRPKLPALKKEPAAYTAAPVPSSKISRSLTVPELPPRPVPAGIHEAPFQRATFSEMPGAAGKVAADEELASERAACLDPCEEARRSDAASKRLPRGPIEARDLARRDAGDVREAAADVELRAGTDVFDRKRRDPVVSGRDLGPRAARPMKHAVDGADGRREEGWDPPEEARCQRVAWDRQPGADR